jgi:CHASE3 domain sensor protein
MDLIHEILKTVFAIILLMFILAGIVSAYLTDKLYEYYENRNKKKQAKS